MTLVEEAERAEKIRNAFIVFTGPCAEDHDAIQDINRAISELSSLSYVLRHIDKLIELDDGTGLNLIHENLKYVHEDVAWTLGDIWSCLGRLGRGYSVEEYQSTWKEITDQSKEVSDGLKLHQVLEDYRLFLESLAKSLESHVTSPTIEKLGPEIRGIHAKRSPASQQEPFPNRSTTPTVSRSNSRKRLTVRPATPSRSNSLKVQSPKSAGMRQPKSYERERPMSPDDSSISSLSDATKLREKPWAPSPPLSPAATISSISRISSNTPSLEANADHWAKQVFKNVASTPLRWSEEETRYHEVPGSKEHSYPNQTYDSVLNLLYPEGVRVSLFCRPTDYRAKIVVLYRDRRGNSEYGCLPLSDLQIRREGSVLRVCRKKSSGKLMPWVSMKFTTIERMVLFASTFIAMRSQDSSNCGPPVPVYDDELRDEEPEFAGMIIDGGFKHALRIFHDNVTGALRLQASVFKGELDRTPVWTAFITHFITSPDWCRRVNRRTIALADLKLHIFSARYKPNLAPTGAFVLQFETKEDTEAFLEVIDTLRLNCVGY